MIATRIDQNQERQENTPVKMADVALKSTSLSCTFCYYRCTNSLHLQRSTRPRSRPHLNNQRLSER